MVNITKYLRDAFEAFINALHFHWHGEDHKTAELLFRFVLDSFFVNSIIRKICVLSTAKFEEPQQKSPLFYFNVLFFVTNRNKRFSNLLIIYSYIQNKKQVEKDHKGKRVYNACDIWIRFLSYNKVGIYAFD